MSWLRVQTRSDPLKTNATHVHTTQQQYHTNNDPHRRAIRTPKRQQPSQHQTPTMKTTKQRPHDRTQQTPKIKLERDESANPPRKPKL